MKNQIIMDEQDAAAAKAFGMFKSNPMKEQRDEPAIRAILEIISSKRDASGNSYWAFRLTDTTSGEVLEIQSPHSDMTNIIEAATSVYGWAKFYTLDKEMSKKALFDMFTRQQWQLCTRGTVEELTAAIQAWRATL
jgi:hypothetical protein